MKFPRNIRLQRSPFDIAPFAAVFFILVILVMLSVLIPTPGLQLQLNLPVADNLPGSAQPCVSVAVGADGRYYFENQIVTEAQLRSGLASAATNSHELLTLIIQADKTVTYDQIVRLALLARDAGIQNALLATLPRLLSASAQP